jgi:hypothetical protein
MMSQSFQVKFAADESIFSSTPDLSFNFSSTPDLSILFTSEVLFLMYFEFSTPVVSSNQILGILEVFKTIFETLIFYLKWNQGSRGRSTIDAYSS